MISLLNRLVYWIVSVNLTRARITLEGGTSTKNRPHWKIPAMHSLPASPSSVPTSSVPPWIPALTSFVDERASWKEYFSPKILLFTAFMLYSCSFTAIEILPKTVVGSRSCSIAVTKLTVFRVGLVLILKLEAEEPIETSKMSTENAVFKRKERLWFSSGSFMFWVVKRSILMAGVISTWHS